MKHYFGAGFVASLAVGLYCLVVGEPAFVMALVTAAGCGAGTGLAYMMES